MKKNRKILFFSLTLFFFLLVALLFLYAYKKEELLAQKEKELLLLNESLWQEESKEKAEKQVLESWLEESIHEEKNKKKTLSFLALGDHLLHPPLVEGADLSEGSQGDGKYDFSYLFKYLKEDIAKKDLSFINQEVISGGDEKGVRGYPMFNVPSDLIYDLENMGFDLVNLATNHALDMGVEGVKYALSHYKKTKLWYQGFFESEEDSEKVLLFEKEGMRFAFLAYTTHTNGISSDEPWRVSYLTEEKVRKDFQKIPEDVDFVLVSVHWGWDNVFPVSEEQKNYAQLFAQLGADLVLGTGPHVLQDLEWIGKGQRTQALDETLLHHNECLVAYSLGNAASAMHGAYNLLEGMLLLDFVKEKQKNYIENVVLEPLVMHYDRENVKNISVYPLEDYTEALLLKNVVKYIDKKTSLPYLKDLYEKSISELFRKK